MPPVLKKSVLKSDKGQRARTVANQKQKRKDNTTQTTDSVTNSQTAKGAIVLDIEFTLKFSSTKPVLPEGETEPEGTGC
jgi:hypothetical protein